MSEGTNELANAFKRMAEAIKGFQKNTEMLKDALKNKQPKARLRGRGYTKPLHDPEKKRIRTKMAKESRRKNRGL